MLPGPVPLRRAVRSTLTFRRGIVSAGALAAGFAVLATLILPAGAAEGGTKVADTRFSVRRGIFTQPFRVEITTRTPGATIRFTTNGTSPGADLGTLYTGPIPIGTTTVLRAGAFREGLEPSGIDTQTYLFPADVPKQDGTGFPATWGTNLDQPVPADYEMDPEIVRHPAYRDDLVPGLLALPSLSLVLAPADLFDPERGIYAHPRESGDAWERPASAELLPHDGRPGFQVDAGLRIQGGWNRRPEESPKHAFRLVFRRRYGAGKLTYPLFPEPGTAKFDELILRAGCNNTWLHWKGSERQRGDYLRDQWMRDSYAAMGRASARGRFVHLYLNGLYWGLYNLTERPSAAFAAIHFGGTPDDYDARNGANLLAGDDAAWKKLIAALDDSPANQPVPPDLGDLLDLPALADFLILNFYGANADWDGASNWYAARRRQPPGPFRFFVWDGERTLENPDDNTLDFDAADSPPRLFQKLRAHPDFQRLFADRARRHLTGDGVLTPGPAAARFRAQADLLSRAIVAESARWGDYRRDAHRYKEGPYELYTRDDHWRPEIQRILGTYFPSRTAAVIRQFETAGLWNPAR